MWYWRQDELYKCTKQDLNPPFFGPPLVSWASVIFLLKKCRHEWHILRGIRSCFLRCILWCHIVIIWLMYIWCTNKIGFMYFCADLCVSISLLFKQHPALFAEIANPVMLARKSYMFYKCWVIVTHKLTRSYINQNVCEKMLNH